jgi:hypothetical protein
MAPLTPTDNRGMGASVPNICFFLVVPLPLAAPLLGALPSSLAASGSGVLGFGFLVFLPDLIFAEDFFASAAYELAERVVVAILTLKISLVTNFIPE